MGVFCLASHIQHVLYPLRYQCEGLVLIHGSFQADLSTERPHYGVGRTVGSSSRSCDNIYTLNRRFPSSTRDISFRPWLSRDYYGRVASNWPFGCGS